MAIPVRRVPVLPLAGVLTAVTVAEMARIARAAAADPYVVAAAVSVVRGVDGRDPVGMAGALRAWLAQRCEFLPDPAIDGDVLRAPDYMIAEIARYGVARGDCDDAAMLAAALGMAVGLPARFVVVAWAADPGRWAHVWAELDAGGRWVGMDVTAPAHLRGRVPVARRWIVEV